MLRPQAVEVFYLVGWCKRIATAAHLCLLTLFVKIAVAGWHHLALLNNGQTGGHN